MFNLLRKDGKLYVVIAGKDSNGKSFRVQVPYHEFWSHLDSFVQEIADVQCALEQAHFVQQR